MFSRRLISGAEPPKCTHNASLSIRQQCPWPHVTPFRSWMVCFVLATLLGKIGVNLISSTEPTPAPNPKTGGGLASLCGKDHSGGVKGITPSDVKFDGSSLRIAIVHARWNKSIIDALVSGTVTKLKERGVKETNIVIESVPGSYELPLACSKCVVFDNIYHNSHEQFSGRLLDLTSRLLQLFRTYWEDSVLGQGLRRLPGL